MRLEKAINEQLGFCVRERGRAGIIRKDAEEKIDATMMETFQAAKHKNHYEK